MRFREIDPFGTYERPAVIRGPGLIRAEAHPFEVAPDEVLGGSPKLLLRKPHSINPSLGGKLRSDLAWRQSSFVEARDIYGEFFHRLDLKVRV